MQLHAWQLADDLALEVFKTSRSLPADLRWLSQQVTRAAVSVPANIAEGYHRGSLREYIQFLSIARGSLAEVEYYLHFLSRSGLIDEASNDSLAQLAFRAGQTLSGLIGALKAKLPSRGDRQRPGVREDGLACTVVPNGDTSTLHPRPSTRDPRPSEGGRGEA